MALNLTRSAWVPFRRREDEIQVIGFLAAHRQRQTGEMIDPPFCGPAGGLRQRLLLARDNFTCQQRRICPRKLKRQQTAGKLFTQRQTQLALL